VTLWQHPFFQVALPIVITFALATWFQSKRIDDLRDSLNRRIDGLDNRLDAIDRRPERIENPFTDDDRRITVLEERTSPLHR
jgi:hypothetical protein